jgi:hypothetical protein
MHYIHKSVSSISIGIQSEAELGGGGSTLRPTSWVLRSTLHHANRLGLHYPVTPCKPLIDRLWLPSAMGMQLNQRQDPSHANQGLPLAPKGIRQHRGHPALLPSAWSGSTTTSTPIFIRNTRSQRTVLGEIPKDRPRQA